MVSPVSSPAVLADMNQDWHNQLKAWQDIFAGEVVAKEAFESLFENWNRFVSDTIKIAERPAIDELQCKQTAEDFLNDLCLIFDIKRNEASKLTSPLYIKATLRQILHGQPNPLPLITTSTYSLKDIRGWAKELGEQLVPFIPEYFRLNHVAAESPRIQLPFLLKEFGIKEVVKWSEKLTQEQIPQYLKLLHWMAKKPYRKAVLTLLLSQFDIEEVINNYRQRDGLLFELNSSLMEHLRGKATKLHILETLKVKTLLIVKRGEVEKIKHSLQRILLDKLPLLEIEKAAEFATALCKFHPLGYMAINDEFTSFIEAYMAKILSFSQDLIFYTQLFNELDKYRKAKLVIEHSPEVEVQKAQARIAYDASEELINLILSHSLADYQDDFSESIQKNVVNKLEQEIIDASSDKDDLKEDDSMLAYKNALIECKDEVRQQLDAYKLSALSIKLKSLVDKSFEPEAEIKRLESQTQMTIVKGTSMQSLNTVPLHTLQLNTSRSILKTLRDKLSAYGERCLKLLSEISMELYGPIELGTISKNYMPISPVDSLRLSR